MGLDSENLGGTLGGGPGEGTRSKGYYHRRAYKRIYLQDRDLQILSYGLEQKFLTVEQVSRRFFHPKETSKNPHQSAYLRTLILQKFGMVALKPLLVGGKVVVTTDRGAGELDSRGRERLEPVATVDYRYFEHDRRVTDVRIALESLNLAHSWRSERYLKSDYQVSRVPDAVFTLTNGQRVALEVEIARKGKDRYQKILGEYTGGKFGEVNLLFYVCNTYPQLERLSELTKEYRWVYFALYDQLMSEKAETIFANQKEHFCLKELL